MDAALYLLLAFLGTALLYALSNLRDADSRFARIERKLNLLIKHAGIEMPQDNSLSEAVKELARDPAKKINAIKTHRDETGVGLKEAKDAVEAYINTL